MADLFIKGKSYGPHAFVMNLREGGKPVEGVVLSDMGKKVLGALALLVQKYKH